MEKKTTVEQGENSFAMGVHEENRQKIQTGGRGGEFLGLSGIWRASHMKRKNVHGVPHQEEGLVG